MMTQNNLQRRRRAKLPHIFLVFAAAAAPLLLAAQGVAFREGAWETILKKAREENKLVFVDVYTTWCGPCKEMDRKVFPDPEVGKMFNASFINYKLDAEKGEGRSISKQYGVGAFPTYLFVNGSGELVHKSVGLSQPREFIAIGETALRQKTADKPLAWYVEAYQAGNRDPDFMQAYVLKGVLQGENMSAVLEAYLQSLSEEARNSDAAIELAGRAIYDCEGLAYDLLLSAQKDAMSFLKRPNAVQRAISTGIREAQLNTEQKAIETQNPELLEKILQAERPGRPSYQIRREELYMTYYRETGNLESYLELAEPKATKLMAMDAAALAKKDTLRHQNLLNTMRAMRQDTTSALFEEIKSHTRPETSQTARSLSEYAAGLFKLKASGLALEQAIQWATRAAELYPESAYILGVYGKALLLQGHTAQAREMFEKALAESGTEREKEVWQKELEKMD